MRSFSGTVGVVAFAALSLLAGASAQAQNVLDQNQPNGPTNIANFSQADLAQSFQPGVATCSGAGILLVSGQGTSDFVTIQLWTALPNAVGATMLAQGTAVGVAGQWVDVGWSPVAVTPGQTYYLVFTGNTTLGIAGSTSNPYANGMTFANTGYDPYTSFDYAFRTWEVYQLPDPIPALGQAGLAALGLLLLAAGAVALRRLG